MVHLIILIVLNYKLASLNFFYFRHKILVKGKEMLQYFWGAE
jgi:hypothetical protein